MLFVYFHFKGMPKINTAENKKSNIDRSCRNLCFITKNLLKMFLVTMLQCLHITGKEYEGSFITTFVYFTMPTWICECN